MDENEENGHRVTAAELVRNFARSRDLARHGPVHITHHGRETHVLCEVSTFDMMRTGAGQPARADSTLTADNALFALADWIDDALVICDENLNIAFVNRAGAAMIGAGKASLVGQAVQTIMSGVAAVFVETQACRTHRHREPNSADIPSPFRKGAWLRFQSFPLGERLVLMFRDITEDVQRHRHANVEAAMLEAMNGENGIGFIRTTVRGSIDYVNDTFCRLVELPCRRLEGVLMTDLVITPDRLLVRETLEQCLRKDGRYTVQARLLTNQGRPTSVRLSLVQLKGTYGTEGAVVLVTENSGSEIPSLLASA